MGRMMPAVNEGDRPTQGTTINTENGALVIVESNWADDGGNATGWVIISGNGSYRVGASIPARKCSPPSFTDNSCVAGRGKEATPVAPG